MRGLPAGVQMMMHGTAAREFKWWAEPGRYGLTAIEVRLVPRLARQCIGAVADFNRALAS